MSNEKLSGVLETNSSSKYNCNHDDSRRYKIQKIICAECEQALGGRLVRLADKDCDYGICFDCILSICELGEFLMLKGFPTSLECDNLYKNAIYANVEARQKHAEFIINLRKYTK